MAIVDINDNPIHVQYSQNEPFCSNNICNVVNIPFYGSGNPVEHNYPGDSLDIFVPCVYSVPPSQFDTQTDQVDNLNFDIMAPEVFRGGFNGEVGGLPVRILNAEVSCRLRCATTTYLDPIFWDESVTGEAYNQLRGLVNACKDLPFIEHIDVTFVKMRKNIENCTKIKDALQYHGEIVGTACVLNRKIVPLKLENFVLNTNEIVRVFMRVNYNPYFLKLSDDARDVYNLTHKLDGMDISLTQWKIDFRIGGKVELVNFYNEEYDDENDRYEISEEDVPLPEEVPLEENE